MLLTAEQIVKIHVLVEKISTQMDKKYAEALKLLAKGPDSNENS